MCRCRVRYIYFPNVVPLAIAMAIYAIGALAFADRAYSKDCPDSFRELMNRLRPEIGSPALLKGFETEDVRLLGSGPGGGHVYLVRPKDASPAYVVKVYDMGGPVIARNDRFALEILDQALNGDVRPGTMKSIKVLEEVNARTLKLEYAAGRDIEEVDWAAGRDRKRLSRLFYRQVQEAKRKIEAMATFTIRGSKFKVTAAPMLKHGFEGKATLEVILENTEPAGIPKKVRIILKSDGIVLTPSGQFLIIDPS